MKANYTEVVLKDGTQVLYSYRTLVAIHHGGKTYVTTGWYSKTTTKHVHQWQARHGYWDAEPVSPNELYQVETQAWRAKT